MSRRANPFSTALGTRAIALIVEHLPAAVADPSAPNPREPLALASTLAGAAFGMAGVTMTHSIAQALGGLLHIAHGEGVAIGTPINLRYNAEKCVDLYADLAHACRLGSGSPQEMASRFVDRVISMLQEVGLPDRVEVPTNVSGGGTLGQWAAKLARNAIEGTPVPIKLNPTKVDESTLTRLLEEILIDQSDS